MNKQFDFKTREGRLEFSRYVAEEGIVLLKNEDKVLPLGGEKIAVFGGAQVSAQAANEGIKVDEEASLGITDAIIKAGVKIDGELYDMYKKWRRGFVKRSYGEWRLSHSTPEMELSRETVLKTAENGAEKAIIVLGRSSHENSDMDIENGDYILSETELNMIENVCAVYKDVILLLHIGCSMDFGFLDDYNIKGILYLNQLGVNGAGGMAKILTGDTCPSGKLTVSLSKHFGDYPSSENFGQHGGGLLQDYREDVYVGYRYFESFDGADKNLLFPFGFGLSYTDFETDNIKYSEADGKISVSATVTNVGKVAGKQVLQLYYGVPEVKDGALLGGPEIQLCDYAKTELLQPGESQRLTLGLCVDDMASYDDLGVLGKASCYVMEKGDYRILIGDSSKSLKTAGIHNEPQNRVTKCCHTVKTSLSERLNRRGEYDKLPVKDDGESRYYGISTLEKTVIPSERCADRQISAFSQLLKGEAVNYNILPGAGGSYRVTFKFTDVNDIISECVDIAVDGTQIKGLKTEGVGTAILNLPLKRTRLTLMPKRDNVGLTAIEFEKVDAKTVITDSGVNVIDSANFYEASFCVDVDNFEDDGFGNSGSYLTGIDCSGRAAVYKIEVERAGTYDFSFKYAFCSEPRPVNTVVTVLASNIVQPLGGQLLEKTYESGEKRIFKESDKFKIILPSGTVYLKIASEEVPFPDISALMLEKNDGAVNAVDMDESDIRRKNMKYEGIERRKLIDDPSLYPKIGIQFKDVYKNPELMRPFLEQLSNCELATIVSGTTNNLTPGGDVGCNSPLHERGIPAAQTADGPCGLRQFDQLPIAFPVGMVLAASFNKELYTQYGECIAHECLRYDVDYLLGPSINILRSPAGGRNCSYFSEDPYVSGITAAYYINGLQKHGIAAVLKHYAANNTEFERLKSNSRVSERALREIYIKGFEIAIKQSDPCAVMSSYNHINDVKACEDYTLITEIPREEWGWDGCFFTDWWNDSRHVDELKAGHDLKMSTGDIDGVTKALDSGELTREQVYACAERIIKMLMKLGRIKKQLESEN